MELVNKVALVTGGSSGIGRETAKLFAAEGARVAISDIDTSGGLSLLEEIKNSGGDAMFCTCDVSNENQVQDWITNVVNQWQSIDILVANAGILAIGSLEKASNLDWDKVLGTNVKGYAFCAKYAIPHIRKRGGGTIVNVASIAALIAFPGFALYNTTKGAVLQLTRSLAHDLATENIRVNCVCPGVIETFQTQQFADWQGLTKEEVIDQLAATVPMKRIGKPQEVAQAILFLASDKASYITATSLVIDGGYTVQ
ncbi:SDR family NAD(P)-dependent oxidoreductase [Nostoc sp. PCC 7107]|uniref:SDR family NAD(P)-dependent oxidoreductase n=1 Tax=Nostoc sp. PCC 7107 TaxID=317936 RepID=UPI00029EFBFC|nr:SDR family NAD(P)-dependent oxidoreductase [Nostoc sp. PCC 7107]AFY41766.1 3-oxoacyl-(acyl-carrier-protein) reductase [Nostoc sp. PCC 7107]